MDLSKKWYKSDFIHIPIEKEFGDYSAIAVGDLDYLAKNHTKEAFLNTQGKGKLSDDELQNIRYHFVVSTSLIARYCVMNGMELEKAYNLNDFYIQKMDQCTSLEEIAEVHNSMCFDYCNKMRIIKQRGILSKPVVLCLDYIYKNIHTRITVKQLAGYTDLSESYLSKLFHKEVGMPISNYITLQKIEKAKNMLAYSEHSFTDIANYLAFSSLGYFIKVFQEQTGIAPRAYREMYAEEPSE